MERHFHVKMSTMDLKGVLLFFISATSVAVSANLELTTFSGLGQGIALHRSICLTQSHGDAPFSKFTDGDSSTCESTPTGHNWIMLSFVDMERHIVEEVSIVMGQLLNPMTNPKVYLTDTLTLPGGSLDHASSKYRLCGKYSGPLEAGLEVSIPCFPDAKAGLYIIIQFDGCDSLNVCEIKAKGKEDTNVALRKETRYRLQYFMHEASLAVDGIAASNHYVHLCASTYYEVQPWLAVNLNNTYDIEMVRIVNRADAVWTRLTGLQIYVKSSMSILESDFSTDLCASLIGYSEGVTYNFPCTAKGSVVVARLSLYHFQILTICELEVYVAPPTTSLTFIDPHPSSDVNIAYTKTVTPVKGDIANKTYLTDGLKVLPTAFTYDSNNTLQFKIDLEAEYFIKYLKIYASKDIPLGKIFTTNQDVCTSQGTIVGAPWYGQFSCSSSIRGQYLYFEFQNPGNGAGIAEVQVFGDIAPVFPSDGNNIAFNKTARAVQGTIIDGQYMTDGHHSPPATTFTYSNQLHIFVFDLGDIYEITAIRMYATAEMNYLSITSVGDVKCVEFVTVKALPTMNRFNCTMRQQFVYFRFPDSGNNAGITEVEIYGNVSTVVVFNNVGSSSDVNIAAGKTVTATKGDIANKAYLTDDDNSLPTDLTYDIDNTLQFKIDLGAEFVINSVRIFASKGIPGVNIFTTDQDICISAVFVTGAPWYGQFSCSSPTAGQYLYFEFPNPGNDAKLVEVQVFGQMSTAQLAQFF